MSATNYIWDFEHDCVLAEKDENGATTAVYTNEPVLYGDLISQRRGSTTSYYHFDAIGSTERLTDASQATTDTYVYSAFGEDKGTTGTTVNPFRYVGRIGYYFDGAELGYDIRERRMSPASVTWLSADPLKELSLDASPYHYAMNNPTMRVDPSGLQAETCPVATVMQPNTIYTIWCEEGRLVPLPVNPPKDPCLHECVLQHENVHIYQFNELCPNWCELPCSHNHHSPSPPPGLGLEWFECTAYLIEYFCIIRKLKVGHLYGCDRNQLLNRLLEIEAIAGDFSCERWPLPPSGDDIAPSPIEPLPPVN